jgi:hypothetical protein
MFCGRENEIVNGLLAPWTSTPVWVPPKAVTAYCFVYAFGGVSATWVYVGEVRPVWADPVTGDVREIVTKAPSSLDDGVGVTPG